MESELGAPISVLFKEFEDQPIAATSLGQVVQSCPLSWAVHSKAESCNAKPTFSFHT